MGRLDIKIDSPLPERKVISNEDNIDRERIKETLGVSVLVTSLARNTVKLFGLKNIRVPTTTLKPRNSPIPGAGAGATGTLPPALSSVMQGLRGVVVWRGLTNRT